MKHTDVEWLYERLERMIPRTSLYDIDKRKYFDQAKEMEKEQKANTWNNAINAVEKDKWESFEQYYEQTYGGGNK